MTNWTWLQRAADIATIATSLVSWRGFVALALAIIAWAVIDWRKVYSALPNPLGTQMNRLQHEQFTLINVTFPDNYLRLSSAGQDRATNAINRCFVLSLNPDFSALTPSSSLNADILKCHARYLALPTLGWLQYTVQLFSLFIAIRATLKRLHEVQREIEVCRRCSAHCCY
jgi:hypothetical protein